MTVYLRKRRGTPALDRAKMLRRARALLRELDMTDRELSILLCSDEEMIELNSAYRHKNKTTDVLSFAQLEGPQGELQPRILGDVVISVPCAQRQASQRKVTLLEESLELLVHGVLHLIGHEHVGVKAARAAAMRREQARLLGRLLAIGKK